MPTGIENTTNGEKPSGLAAQPEAQDGLAGAPPQLLAPQAPAQATLSRRGLVTRPSRPAHRYLLEIQPSGTARMGMVRFGSSIAGLDPQGALHRFERVSGQDAEFRLRRPQARYPPPRGTARRLHSASPMSCTLKVLSPSSHRHHLPRGVPASQSTPSIEWDRLDRDLLPLR